MSVLEKCRKKLGSAPRSFTPEVLSQNKVSYNPLLSTHPWDTLMGTFFQQSKIREHGSVVWAHLLQANDFLFNPGLNGESHPGTIIHGGPDLDDPEVLEEVANRIATVQARGSNDPDSKIVKTLMHPSRRSYWVPVPQSLAGSHEVYCSAILIFRKLLPPQPNGATLQKSIFPLLVAAEQTKYVMQLPCCFWPKEFVEFWEFREDPS